MHYRTIFTVVSLSTLLINSIARPDEQQKKPVIVIGLETITPYRTNIAGKWQVLQQTARIAPAIFWHHPKMMLHAPSIINRAREIAKTTNGMDNLINILAQDLEQQGYGKLTPQERDAIIQIIVMPIQPNNTVNSYLQELKNKKFELILATNQAITQHMLYKKIMKSRYNLDIEQLFSAGTVSAPTYHAAEYSNNNDYYELEKNWLIAHDVNPSEAFFKALREVADRQEKDAPIYMAYRYKKHSLKDVQPIAEKFGITLFESIEELEKKLIS